MNLPNILTLVRFGLVPVYLLLFFSELPGRIYWALAVIVLAGLTDVIDGFIARRYGQVTQIGIMLDPLADKCMMLAVFLSLLLSLKISIWATVAIFLRELAMILYATFFYFRGKKTVPANKLGKLTTVLFYISLFLLLLDVAHAKTLLWVVIAISYLATLIYFFQFKMINRA